MKIIQFLCDIDPPASVLKQLMVDQVNIWSRLQWLSTDPEYVTHPFSMDDWHTHTTKTNLHWADWGEIYNQLGDDGKRIADQMLGSGAMQGILLRAPLVDAMPEIKLQVIDVADPVADGYLPAPAEVLP